MAKRKKKDNAILGEYEIKQTLKEDKIYQYVEAVGSEGETVHLQILRSPESIEALESVRNYFDRLIAINADNLIRPDLLLQFSPTSLTLVYSKQSVGESVLKPISKNLDQTLECLYQASECLQTLHNRRIYHGLIRPDSYRAIDNRVYLKGFGYAPLITMCDKEAIKECGDFLPPDVLASGTITQSSDIYSFARTISIWEPQIIESDWYIRATHPEPSKRFSRIREAFSALEVELKHLFGEPETEVKVNQESQKTNGSGSNLLPKFNIEAVAVPLEAGNIEGAGLFKRDEKITITATPNLGWEFEKWSGDMECNEPSIIMVATGNKKIYASFKLKLKTIPSWNINVALEPKEGGEVSGSGCFNQGDNVTLVAKAFDGWIFSGWSGDINGKENMITIVADTNKNIIARFEQVIAPPKVETGTLMVKPDPPEAGKVMGSGTCILGQSRTIMAIPTNGWEFSEWLGDAKGTNNPMKVVVDADKLVIGKFALLQKFKLTQTSNPPEVGIVVADRYCPSNSQEKMLARSTDPARWEFSHWSGDLQGSKNPTKLLMDSDKLVIANFTEINVSHKDQDKSRPKPLFNQNPSEEGLGKVFESKVPESGEDNANKNTSKPSMGGAFTQPLSTRDQWSVKNVSEERKPPKLGRVFQD